LGSNTVIQSCLFNLAVKIPPEAMMEQTSKNRKLPRREFLQTVAAGGTLVPALGLGMPASASPTGDTSSAAPSKAADDHDVVSLENETLRVNFDVHSGSLVSLESKLTGWRIQNRRELARSFVMFAPLPDRHFNPILGEKNKLVSIAKSADGRSVAFVWSNLESEHAGKLDITLKSTVTLDEHGLSFDAEVINHSPYVVESVSYPILGDLAVPEGGKSLTRENLAYAGMQRVPLYPTFTNERGYFGVDYPIQMVPTPGRPFVLVSGEQQGLYTGAHDTSSKELIEWTFELKPGYENSLDNQDPAEPSISGHAVSLVFSVAHFPFAAAGESAQLSRVVMQPYKGTWHKGVDVYKQWRSTWFQQPATPTWARDVHSWQQLNINSSEDDLRLRYEDLPKIGRDCAKYGVKAGRTAAIPPTTPTRGLVRKTNYAMPSRRFRPWASTSSCLTNTPGPTSRRSGSARN
jgi:hypothetical protein